MYKGLFLAFLTSFCLDVLHFDEQMFLFSLENF